MNNKIVIQVTEPSGNTYQLLAQKGCTPMEIAQELMEPMKYPLTSCLWQGENIRIDEPLPESGKLILQDMTSNYGNYAYQSTLKLLFLQAVREVLGNVSVRFNNSLSKGIYTVIHADLKDETVRKIEECMHELVKENSVINEKVVNTDTSSDPGAKALFMSSPDLQTGFESALKDTKAVFFVHTLPRTGLVRFFSLKRYRNGVILRFPYQDDPGMVPEYHEQRLLYEAFAEQTRWCKLLEIQDAADLNNQIKKENGDDLVKLNEALHERRIAEIATEIVQKKKRLVLIAGPSSSGKTTFAHRLCIQLRVLGTKPLYLGTDDYFINREDMPVNEKGVKDFESLQAVDLLLFQKQMNDLLNGQKVNLPRFNFITGKKEYGQRNVRLDPQGIIVVEGIHGLNPKLTENMNTADAFRIYVSPLTQLNIDPLIRIPTTDVRILRRLVRDSRTRGMDAATTIHDWPLVRRGEDVNIFPFNEQADVFFNSTLLYETSALKKYAEPQLRYIKPDQEEYAEAQRLLKMLACFVEMDDTVIPNTSIIREFIGGSVMD